MVWSEEEGDEEKEAPLNQPRIQNEHFERPLTRGTFVYDFNRVEHLAAVDTVVFDKTGTLTHSELAVTDVVVLDPRGCSEADLLALVASVEEHASHPVAKAVVEAARERDLQHITHGEVDYLVAHGMAAQVGPQGQTNRIRIGSRHYLQEHEGIAFDAHEDLIDRLQDEGKILLFVGGEGGPVGLIALRDTLRADAAETLQRLRALGVKQLVMITGDREAKARALAEELGLDAFHAEMPPEGKAGVIEALQRAGQELPVLH
jgi:P-type E1-E2 ATPase